MNTHGILIDPSTCSITEVEIESWRNIAPLLGCDLFACIHVDADHTLYVDDCGLLKSGNPVFGVDFYHQPLAGKGLLLGTTMQGDSCDCGYTLEDVQKMVAWKPHMMVR